MYLDSTTRAVPKYWTSSKTFSLARREAPGVFR
jgi:hypothetical protein